MDTMLALPIRGTFYGVRGSFPTREPRIGGQTTCHTLQFGNELVVFDTGSGMIDLGRELMKPYIVPGKTIHDIDVFMNMYFASGRKIENLGQSLLDEGYVSQRDKLRLTIIHSHVHGDHLFGIQAFKPIFLPNTEINMVGGLHDGLDLHQIMERFVFAHPIFPVKWQWLASKRSLQIVNPNEHFTIPCEIGGDIQVWTLPMNHPNQANGFRFEWGGKTIAVTLDHEHGHAYDQNIVKLWEGADIVVTEAQYTDEQYARCKTFGHISESAAAQHAKEAKPGRIFTTHHDPDSDFETVQRIARTIERVSGVPTQFAVEGMVF